MIIDLNTKLPSFGRKILDHFGLEDMGTLFLRSLSTDKDKKRFNLYPDFDCVCDCGASITISYRGFRNHFPLKEYDYDLVFSPHLKHERGERADNINVALNPQNIKTLQDFLWSVEKAQAFKADFVSDMWCVLELHGDLGYHGFKIMVRGEKGKVKCYLYEANEKLPLVPAIKEAENSRECLALILELNGDPDSFEQGDKNNSDNPMSPEIMRWAKEFFTLNGFGDKDIHFSWTRKYKYLTKKDHPLPI